MRIGWSEDFIELDGERHPAAEQLQRLQNTVAQWIVIVRPGSGNCYVFTRDELYERMRRHAKQCDPASMSLAEVLDLHEPQSSARVADSSQLAPPDLSWRPGEETPSARRYVEERDGSIVAVGGEDVTRERWSRRIHISSPPVVDAQAADRWRLDAEAERARQDRERADAERNAQAAGDVPAFPGLGPVVTPGEGEVFKGVDEAPEFEPEAPRRHTNVCFTHNDGTAALASALCLAAGRSYRLRADIGPLSADSIVANSTVFDETSLPEDPEGHWLDIVVSSSDFTVANARHRLFLPRSGASWVCDCPQGTAHVCAPETRARHLSVPVETPARPGEARLRLLIYFQRNLIESHVVTATVAEQEWPGAGARSVIDYTLTDGMRDVARMPPTDMNILTERRADGSHTLVLNGDTGHPVSITLTEGQMEGAIDAARRSLYAMHVETTGSESLFGKRTYRNRYNENNAKTLGEFKKDFAAQAYLGWQLWVALRGNDADMRDALRTALASRSTIQIARTEHNNFVYPWSLVYDIPLGSDPAEHRFCAYFDETADWTGGAALHRCPYEDTHGFNTLCPFGFWGLKHMIEQPPSARSKPGLRTSIALVDKPSAVIARSTSDLDMTRVAKHLKRIGDRLARFDIATCETSHALRTALSRRVELVYFYCHGRTVTNAVTNQTIPALEIGDNDVFEPADVTAWSDGLWPKGHWQEVSPLVFINGCHTTDITPNALASFVDAFVGARAAGVIGTEVAIYQDVAAEIAELFYTTFVTETSVGELLRTMRWQLLAKGNLMGLAYTPYCSGRLGLSGPASA